MLKTFFLATMPKSELSKAAQVMNDLNLDDLVYFVVRRATDDQWEDLYDILQPTLVTRIPLSKGKRQMVFCHPMHKNNDLLEFEDYRFVLKTVLGNRCRIPVRVCHRIQVEEEQA